MPNNDEYQWSGIPPHLRAEFDVESLQQYLSYRGSSAPAKLFAQVDPDFYRESYTEYLQANSDPVEFFFRQGWKLGHQPNQWFQTDFYLGEYGDIRQAGVNPFEHFLFHGFRENRHYSANSMNSLLDVVNKRSDQDPLNLFYRSTNQPPMANIDQVFQEIKQRLLPDSIRHVVAFGHDNYTRHIGGIQIVVGVEQQKFEATNTNYIFIFPCHPRLSLAPLQPTPTFQIIVNGKVIPLRCELTGILEKLGNLEALVVHSIYGHDPAIIAQESQAVPIQHFVWWVHDYSANCENHLLAHNNSRSCNDPPPDSQICLTCIYGSRRLEHVNRVQHLVNAAPWRFMAPSESAKKISMSGSTPLPIPEVVPHGDVSFGGSRAPFDPQDRKLRIAFVGQPVHHKGWKVFRQLVDFSKSRRLPVEFFHLGSATSDSIGISYINLAQTSSNLGLTTDLLIEHRIDAVFIWSIHQETFNLVTYESIAAGCIVITRIGSGNIAAAALSHDRSLTYESEIDLFSDEQIVEKITQKILHGCPIGHFVFTGTTFPMIGGDRQ